MTEAQAGCETSDRARLQRRLDAGLEHFDGDLLSAPAQDPCVDLRTRVGEK